MEEGKVWIVSHHERVALGALLSDTNWVCALKTRNDANVSKPAGKYQKVREGREKTESAGLVPKIWATRHCPSHHSVCVIPPISVVLRKG